MTEIIAAASGGFVEMLHDTADTFGWNWQLFLSQVISFCIVALLLRRFAYKPIVAVLEERRRTIEESQLNAEKIKKQLADADQRYAEILAKAREATAIEHDRAMETLKRELGRLVVDTTAKVTGKVLTAEDQRRLQDEASRQLA